MLRSVRLSFCLTVCPIHYRRGAYRLAEQNLVFLHVTSPNDDRFSELVELKLGCKSVTKQLNSSNFKGFFTLRVVKYLTHFLTQLANS